MNRNANWGRVLGYLLSILCTVKTQMRTRPSQLALPSAIAMSGQLLLYIFLFIYFFKASSCDVTVRALLFSVHAALAKKKDKMECVECVWSSSACPLMMLTPPPKLALQFKLSWPLEAFRMDEVEGWVGVSNVHLFRCLSAFYYLFLSSKDLLYPHVTECILLLNYRKNRERQFLFMNECY